MILGFGKISGYNLFSIVVDINGHNNRNVMGKDVFVFYPYNSSAMCRPYNENAAPKTTDYILEVLTIAELRISDSTEMIY